MAKATIITDSKIRAKKKELKRLSTKWATLVSKEMDVDISKVYSFISGRIKDNGSRILFISACDTVKTNLEKIQNKPIA